jgi:hypothetical protein
MHLGTFSPGAAGLVMAEMTNVNPVGRITSHVRRYIVGCQRGRIEMGP